MTTTRYRPVLPTLAASTIITLTLCGNASALELYDNAKTKINLNVTGVAGAFHSQKGYAQSETAEAGGRDWQEGFIKYGLDATHTLSPTAGSLYANVAWTSSGTWGQGDAAGFTTGDERRTHLEDLAVGWKSGELIPALGTDGLDVSVGRQYIQVGDGFLISGDSLNFGEGVLGGDLDRGGAYYLAARQSFEKTAVVRLGGDTGWRGDLMWLKSGNRAQAKPEMAVGTLEHVTDDATLGATYIKVLDTDRDFAFLYPDREDTRVYSVYGHGNAGVENLFLAGQFAWQEKGNGADENAWYAEAGWTFSDLAWSPYVSYRFSRFSDGYDPLFYGNGRALGTWFQGEVAANYAGPFATNARIHQVTLSLTPADNLGLGLLAYRFDTLDTNQGPNLDGNEIDLYGTWTINDHWWVMPLVGRYDPDSPASRGGSQLGGSGSNYYTQLLVGFNF
ncbi:alginate export family protein [Larsenimonas suaedae]|uniref:Alginate export family protein n=1 Tax=Larsenimonas suaedae TaxID=1851019 RepID=A0ABU1GWL0_9GAMM|nr:alginate export family protein [Larsenimonas suaedae]MCM2973322.1 alginate export family protein [Larsenimonas suaedae]MDR5896215.1 alginate export family protein [Larsenimonas suaedae]